MIRQGSRMKYRLAVPSRPTASLVGIALVLAAPTAQAQQATMPRDDVVTYSTPPASPAVLEVANPQVEKYQQTAEQAGQIDPRAKAAWLAECRRRANINGTPDDKASRSRSESASDAAKAALTSSATYDYCEAYLDDYYRNYANSTGGGNITYQSQGLPQPAQLARATSAQQAQLPYEEIITEEYIPVRTRSIARRPASRPIRDKRVRLYPR